MIDNNKKDLSGSGLSSAALEDRIKQLPEGDSMFAIGNCDCGDDDCGQVVFAMIRPKIRPVTKESEELIATVPFPKSKLEFLARNLAEYSEGAFDIVTRLP